METKIDWRFMLSERICTRCPYYNVCYMDHDCKALGILVKICENLDCGNPDD